MKVHVARQNPDEVVVRREDGTVVAKFFEAGWWEHRLTAFEAACSYVESLNRNERIFGKLKQKLDGLGADEPLSTVEETEDE